jgi:RNA polymerase sigma-70 factor (ECF subfamily)
MMVVDAAKRDLAMQLAVTRPRAELNGYSDEHLVELARQGGENAVRALVGRHNQRLFRVARAIVRDDAEAEDVVQEAYVRALTRLGAFRGEARFSTWLTRIALNEALGRARRRQRSSGLALPDAGGGVIVFPGSPPAPTADAELGRKQVGALLEAAVDALPEAFRIVFVLREVEGMSTEDTAAQLGLNPATVKTRLHRARRLMRATIEARLSTTFAGLFPFDGERCAGMADKVIERLARAAGMP